MTQPTAASLISSNVTLPTLPSVVAKINSLVDDPDVGTREIGQAVADDAPIAAEVLRVANSAYYGLRETVLSTEHASAVLGVRQLRNIAVQAAVISQFDHLKSSAFDIDGLWKHSILTGHMCARIARKCRARIGLAPDEFHVIGLLHDMGKVLLLEAMGDTYLEAFELSRTSGEPLVDCEERVLGFDHAAVGALMVAHWKFPTTVVNAIQYHHGPVEHMKDPVVNLVARTNQLASCIARGDEAGAAAAFDEAGMRALGLTAPDLEQAIERGVEMFPQIKV